MDSCDLWMYTAFGLMGVVGILVLMMVVIACVYCRRRKRRLGKNKLSMDGANSYSMASDAAKAGKQAQGGYLGSTLPDSTMQLEAPPHRRTTVPCTPAPDAECSEQRGPATEASSASERTEYPIIVNPSQAKVTWISEGVYSRRGTVTSSSSDTPLISPGGRGNQRDPAGPRTSVAELPGCEQVIARHMRCR